MEGTLIRRKADFDKTLVSKGSTESVRRKVGKLLAGHKAKLRQRASMLSYGCPLHVKIYRVINQNLTAGSPLRLASIFLDHHSKSIPHKTADLVDETVQFRPLETAIRNFVLYSGAVNGNYAAVRIS